METFRKKKEEERREWVSLANASSGVNQALGFTIEHDGISNCFHTYHDQTNPSFTESHFSHDIFKRKQCYNLN